MSSQGHYPASTGLSGGRASGPADRWRLWARQVLGSRRLLRARFERSSPQRKSVGWLLGTQLFLAVFVVLLLVSKTEPARLAPLVLLVAGVALLVAWSLRSYSLVTQMALAEATDKSLRFVRASPLPAGAWMLGRSLVLFEEQLWGASLLAPTLTAGALLTGRSLGELVLLATVPLVGIPLMVALSSLGVAKAEEPSPARRGGAAALLKAQGAQGPQQAAQAAVLVPILIIVPVMMVVGLGGPGGLLPFLAWILAILPAFAAISAVVPQFTVDLGGHSTPAWVLCLALHVALTPLVWSLARLRVKPADSPLGSELRLSALFAWSALAGVAAVALAPSSATRPGLLVGVLVVAPLLVGLIAGSWSGAISIGDIGAARARSFMRLVALVRSTAEGHAAMVVVTVTACLLLFGGWVGDGRAALLGTLTLTALPVCVIGAVLGRSTFRASDALRYEKPGRTGAWVGALPVLWILLCVAGLAVVAAVQAGELDPSRLPQAVLDSCDLIASSCPVIAPDLLLRASAPAGSVFAAADPLGLPDTHSPLLAGFAIQVAIALSAWTLDRWSGRRWEAWKAAVEDSDTARPEHEATEE